MTTHDRSADAVYRHVMIATDTATYTVAGERVTGPVTSIDHLEKLIDYAFFKCRLLQPFPVTEPAHDDEVSPARLWLVGNAGRQLIGAGAELDTDQLREEISSAMVALVNRGWELKGTPDSRLVLTRAASPRPIVVEIVVEPRPWLGAGMDTGNPRELGQRVGLWYSTLGVLPASSAHASGAVLLDQIMNAREARGTTSAILSESAPLPPTITPDLRIQPLWAGLTDLVEQQQQLDRAVDLVLLQQQLPHLASAGMIMLGYGQPEPLTGPQAVRAAADTKPPFGMWRITHPAAESITQPALLPAPHPAMLRTEPTRGWVTTEDLTGLIKPIHHGGAGLTVDQLAIDQAYVWPKQARLLEAWTTRLREALKVFTSAGQPALCALVEEVGREYTTAMGDPDVWGHNDWSHHFRPAHAAAIAAHIRLRGRRIAIRLSREYRALPLYVSDADSIYALGLDEHTKKPIDLSDTHTENLGRVLITRRAPLANETVLAVVQSDTDNEVAEALTRALDITMPNQQSPPAPTMPTPPVDEPPTIEQDTAPQDTADSEDTAAAEPIPESREEPAATTGAEAPTPPARKKTKPTSRKPAGSTTRQQEGETQPAAKPTGFAAAVLHVDGLWLPDGTHIELAEPITHVGQVAELAYTYDIGYPLSENYCESGQIWITQDACAQFGIDIRELAETRATKRGEVLHELTENIPFVTDAVAEGWRLGGGGEDKSVQRLGVWTRAYQEDSDRTGVWIVLIAGMDTPLAVDDPLDDHDDEDSETDAGNKGLPILAGKPNPVQVARRLQRLAEALDFPFKINGGVTGIDMLVQARPRPTKDGKRGWTVKDWKNIVLAPSTTELPYGLGDVERDYNWTRIPTAEEMRERYVHAYDRGGSYFAALGTLELPIGEPVHHPNGARFNPTTPGFWLVNVPPCDNRFMPYVLNPSLYQFNEPKWVDTSRIEMALKFGYELEILEALLWPQHGRIFRLWTERFSNASVLLDTDDPDDQAARNQSKVIRSRSLGVMSSARYLKDKLGYHPARWAMAVGKANANIAYRANDIGVNTGRWPIAADHDTLLYVSNDPNPQTAWPGEPETYGRTFGKYKHEGSALLADHLQFLDGSLYRGRQYLLKPDRWRELLPTLSEGEPS